MVNKPLSKTAMNKSRIALNKQRKQAEQEILKNQIAMVMENIQGIQYRRAVASISICKYYAAKAKETFRRFQGFNVFWNNQTSSAYAGVFSDVLIDGDEIGFFLAHDVEYGVYLELANDRKHESLWPVVSELFPEFQEDLRKIWE